VPDRPRRRGLQPLPFCLRARLASDQPGLLGRCPVFDPSLSVPRLAELRRCPADGRVRVLMKATRASCPSASRATRLKRGPTTPSSSGSTMPACVSRAAPVRATPAVRRETRAASRSSHTRSCSPGRACSGWHPESRDEVAGTAYLMPMCSGSVGAGAAGALGSADATVVKDRGLGRAPVCLPAPGFAASGATEGAADSAAPSVEGGDRTTGAGFDTASGSGAARGEGAAAGAPAGGGARPPRSANPTTSAATPRTPATA